MKATARFVLLSICVLWCIVVTIPVYANNLTVDTNVDGVNVAGCSLREAIANANDDAATYAGCGAGFGPDIITFNFSNTITLTGGEISVTSNITINEGAGDVTITNGSAQSSSSRIFNISTPNGALTLDGLALSGGNTTTSGGCIQLGANGGGSLIVTNGSFTSCNTTSGGGAIGSSSGVHSINISGSAFTGNTSTAGGGAIQQTGSNSDLSITTTTFTNNVSSNAQGGAINYSGTGAAGGTFSITGSTFTSNRAQSGATQGRGGAIFFTAGDGTMSGTISGSTFNSNQALNGSGFDQGGAIFKQGTGSLTISSSSFSGNSAEQGGAIYNGVGSITVSSSRLEQNSADEGGAFYGTSGTSGATEVIESSCIVDNDDTGVFDNGGDFILTADGGAGGIGNSKWWGSSWGPRVTAAGGGSALSHGDSINGNGLSTVPGVDVNLTNAGDANTQPTGNFLTSAPVRAGQTCLSCTATSSTGSGRVCIP
jgi:predicted outer membrane repeat protein